MRLPRLLLSLRAISLRSSAVVGCDVHSGFTVVGDSTFRLPILVRAVGGPSTGANGLIAALVVVVVAFVVLSYDQISMVIEKYQLLLLSWLHHYYYYYRYYYRHHHELD